MSERVRVPVSPWRIVSAGALVLLLSALLFQSLALHVHVSVSDGAALESAARDSHSASAVVEAAGCVACRIGSARIGIAGGGASPLRLVAEPAHTLPREATPELHARLVRVASPPRAPPV
jgi:hypothetical protein